MGIYQLGGWNCGLKALRVYVMFLLVGLGVKVLFDFYSSIV